MVAHNDQGFLTVPCCVLLRRAFISLCLISVLLTVVGCDPEDLLNDYFSQMGLTRLAVLQSDVEPGTVILTKGDEAFLGDHILDFVDQRTDPAHEYGTFGGSAKDEVDVVLRKFSSKTQLTGKTAMSFVVNIFQLSPSLDLGLTGTVSVTLPDAKVRKMKVASLEKFLTRSESAMFQRKVREWDKKGLTAFIAYEVYRAKSLKVLSAEETDVAPSLKANSVTPLPIGGTANVAYKKLASNELIIAGNRYYAFAVRTAKLIVRPNQPVEIDRTAFVKPQEWGIKSAGTDDEYAAPLMKNFKPVNLKTGLAPDL
jgi:hypothetical protein